MESDIPMIRRTHEKASQEFGQYSSCGFIFYNYALTENYIVNYEQGV